MQQTYSTQNISLFQSIRMAFLGKEQDLSKGSLRTTIIILSIPMILEMVMESFFSMVDIFFVGQIGTSAVATIGLTESVMSIVYSVAIGISMAATALIARRAGEKKWKKAGDISFQVILIGCVFGLLTGVLGYMYAEELLRVMGASEAVISEGVGYTRIIFLGNLSVLLLFLINGIFRGAGNAAVAMHSLWFSNLLNIVLDPLLIFGIGPFPEMGLEGAAYATLIGRSAGVVYQLVVLVRGTNNLILTRKNFVFKIKHIKKILRISTGGMGQFLIESASWLFLIRFVSEFGSEVVAGYTIAYRLMMFIILPSWGLANAAATLVGQNLGAGNPERAEASVWKTAKYNMIFLGVISVLFLLVGHTFIQWFTHDPAVIAEGVTGLRIFCSGFVFFALGMVLTQSFNGAGDTKTPVWINILVFILIQIPLAYFLSFTLNMEAAGIYLSIAISYGMHALVSWFLFRQGKWKAVVV